MLKSQNIVHLTEDIFEPAWPYDMDDSYMDLDLGVEDEELHKLEGAIPVKIFKRPWFKQNYRQSAKKNFKLYRRPYFYLAEE